jgi:hypothetical protein
MLANASISRAHVNKAKPRAARPAIRHTHAGRRRQRGAGKRRRQRRRRDIPVAGGCRRKGGLGPPLKRRVGGRRRGGGPGVAAEDGSGSGGAESGRAAASGTEMRVGEGRRRHGRACWRWETTLRSCRGGAARRVGEEGRIGDGHGEERRR